MMMDNGVDKKTEYGHLRKGSIQLKKEDFLQTHFDNKEPNGRWMELL